ncbi:hypothetical protein B0H13DRAFT_1875806 [Mycena leptocephala]|nr:hypothetical protein B0H13DRAFT_1875806 [Mycena leptocephala]
MSSKSKSLFKTIRQMRHQADPAEIAKQMVLDMKVRWSSTYAMGVWYTKTKWLEPYTPVDHQQLSCPTLTIIFQSVRKLYLRRCHALLLVTSVQQRPPLRFKSFPRSGRHPHQFHIPSATGGSNNTTGSRPYRMINVQPAEIGPSSAPDHHNSLLGYRQWKAHSGSLP